MPDEAKDKQKGRLTVIPYLVVSDVEAQIQFLQTVLNAEVTEEPMKRPDGSIGHAEVKIGDSTVMMGGASGENKPFPGMLYVYVEDCDAAFKCALDAGAKAVAEPMDQEYGDRHCGIEDPQGNQWWLWSPLKDMKLADG